MFSWLTHFPLFLVAKPRFWFTLSENTVRKAFNFLSYTHQLILNASCKPGSLCMIYYLQIYMETWNTTFQSGWEYGNCSWKPERKLSKWGDYWKILPIEQWRQKKYMSSSQRRWSGKRKNWLPSRIRTSLTRPSTMLHCFGRWAQHSIQCRTVVLPGVLRWMNCHVHTVYSLDV